MKKLAILAAFIFCPFAIQAQEVFINADLVSSYIWRGMKNGKCFRTAYSRRRVERMDPIGMGIDRIQKRE